MRIEAERLEVTDSRARDRETPKKAWERLRQKGEVSQQGRAKQFFSYDFPMPNKLGDIYIYIYII